MDIDKNERKEGFPLATVPPPAGCPGASRRPLFVRRLQCRALKTQAAAICVTVMKIHAPVACARLAVIGWPGRVHWPGAVA